MGRVVKYGLGLFGLIATVWPGNHPWVSMVQPQELVASQKGKERLPRIYKAGVQPHWFAQETKFWYRNDLAQGRREFIVVDAEKGERRFAFDHARLAAALSQAVGQPVAAERLPIDNLEFSDDLHRVRFSAFQRRWQCDLQAYRCEELGPAKRMSATDPSSEAKPLETVTQPVAAEFLTADDDPFFDPLVTAHSASEVGLQPARGDERPLRSPNGRWAAIIRNFNVVLRAADGSETQLTRDGKDGNAYGLLHWSPDSRRLVAFRIEPGDRKEVYLIESSPPGGGRARLHTRPYMLPGDKYPRYELHLFDVEQAREIPVRVDPIDFGVPRLRWSRDGRRFSWQQVDRGHQRFRLIEVDASNGTSRYLIDERSDTFIWTAHTESLGMPLITWLNRTNELIYVSEKSGWRHLYLIDADKGEQTHAITQGEYVVRGIDFIDEQQRQIWFRASGRPAD
ncbi:MAG: DPP IV N-terminal domain-containing protein, partial [Gemmataceae bacterium]|nr:DPP IV N-terminal domain-containing protein [Gemmataceae bacterium]